MICEHLGKNTVIIGCSMGSIRINQAKLTVQENTMHVTYPNFKNMFSVSHNISDANLAK